MLLVVLYHSIAIWMGGWFDNPAEPNDIFKQLAIWLNSFHIYGFTLVSGYLFYFLKYEKKQYADTGLFVKKKVKRILIPYAFASIVWVIPWQVFYYRTDISDLVKQYLFMQNPSQLWFLGMLFGVFMIAILLPSRVHKNWILLGVISCGMYITGLLLGLFIPNMFQIQTSLQYFVFFAIGMMLRKHADCFVWNIPCILWVIADIILFWVKQIVDVQSGTLFRITGVAIEFLLHMIGAIMAFTVLNWIANRINWRENKVIVLLHKHNFTIYLFHQQVIYAVITLLNGRVFSVVLALANFAMAIFISLFISIILHRWKTTRFLIGEKE